MSRKTKKKFEKELVKVFTKYSEEVGLPYVRDLLVYEAVLAAIFAADKNKKQGVNDVLVSVQEAAKRFGVDLTYSEKPTIH